MRIAGFFLGFLLLTAGTVQAQIPVTEKSIVSKTGPLHLDIQYPQTGISTIDKLLDRSGLAKTDPEELSHATPAEPYSVSARYEITRNDAQFFSVMIGSSIYTGGAHGLPDKDGYVFLMPDAWRVFLPELVDGPRGMKKISDLAIADLKRQAVEKGIDVQRPDLLHDIESGASAAALDHTPFRWQQNELVLDFAPYSLFGYAYNPPVHIPMSAIADIVRPDPRAPSPSFACGRARSAIEKSICGDVALARLDRELADRYAMAIDSHRYGISLSDKAVPSDWNRKHLAEDKAALDKLVSGQRAWQAERDRQCANGDASCLAASYKKRLADANRF